MPKQVKQEPKPNPKAKAKHSEQELKARTKIQYALEQWLNLEKDSELKQQATQELANVKAQIAEIQNTRQDWMLPSPKSRPSFSHPCTLCQSDTYFNSFGALESAWELYEKEGIYQCRGCQVMGRTNKMSIKAFAEFILQDYDMNYRRHRASLFI